MDMKESEAERVRKLAELKVGDIIMDAMENHFEWIEDEDDRMHVMVGYFQMVATMLVATNYGILKAGDPEYAMKWLKHFLRHTAIMMMLHGVVIDWEVVERDAQ